LRSAGQGRVVPPSPFSRRPEPFIVTPSRQTRGLHYTFVGEASARLQKIFGDRAVALMIDFFNVHQLSACRSPEDTERILSQ